MSKPTVRTTTGAVVTLTVQISNVGSWGPDCTTDQVYRQSAGFAMHSPTRGMGINCIELADRSEVAALQSTIAQLQARVQDLESGRGEPFGWVDKWEIDRIEHKQASWATLWKTDGSKNPSRGKPSVALFTAPPAPVAVVLPNGWQDTLFEEMERRFALRKMIDDDHMVNDDTQVGVEFAIEWIEACLDATAALKGERK